MLWSLLVEQLPAALAGGEQVRDALDMRFGRIELVVAHDKVKRVIPKYEMRPSDSERSEQRPESKAPSKGPPPALEELDPPFGRR